MKYLLDTNSVIALNKRHPELTARLRQSPPEQFALSSIVLMELYYGAYKSMKTTENLRDIEKLPFPVLPFTAENAQRVGYIRAELERLGTPIGNFDLLADCRANAQPPPHPYHPQRARILTYCRTAMGRLVARLNPSQAGQPRGLPNQPLLISSC